MDRGESWSRVSSIAIGVLLIVVGVVFLIVQVSGIELPFDIGRVGWPLWVIASGLALLVVGLFMPAAPGLGLSIAGAIVTTVGLILAYQSSTGHYASWAYAWALAAPASVGAAMLLWGMLHWRRDVIRGGLWALIVGLILFLVGFAFFEGVLNIGADRGLAPLGRQALPIALILAGVLVMATRLWPRRHPRDWRDWQAPPPISPPPPADAPVSVPAGPADPTMPGSASASPAAEERS